MKCRLHSVAFILILLCSVTSFGQSLASDQPIKSTSPDAASPSAPATPAPAATTPLSTTTASVPNAKPRPRAVPLMISVTDSSGNPLMGLAKEQLTLMDGNQLVQPLNIYKAQDVPLHLGIALLATPG